MLDDILGKCQVNAFPLNVPLPRMLECSQNTRFSDVFRKNKRKNFEEMNQTIQTFQRMLLSSLESGE